MADLPELSDSAKRRLELRWLVLLNAHELTGDHFHWHEREAARLARVAAQSPTSGVNHRGADTDEVGVFASVTVACERFNALLEEYWRLWHLSGDRYESFATWLPLLKRQVTEEISSRWQGRSKRLDRWHQTACRPKVEDALQLLVEGGIARARAEELKRLEGRAKTPPESERNDVLIRPTVAAGKRRGAASAVAAELVVLAQKKLADDSTITERGSAVTDMLRQTHEPNEKVAIEAEPNAKRVIANHKGERREVVDDFLARCNQELAGQARIRKHHIWQAAGHTDRRQFSYWQQGSAKATGADRRSFSRIVVMAPGEFIALLRRKAILSKPEATD